jgi:uncharacterized repeat protein (TIGR01451 family)/LPXTG-motif cell wall-anchored protein
MPRVRQLARRSSAVATRTTGATRRLAAVVVGIVCAFVLAPHVSADVVTPFSGTIGFDEYPFPVPTQVLQGPNGTSSVTYNLFDDATGAELLADNGDLPDVTFVYATSARGTRGATGRPSIEINPTADNQLTGRTGYSGVPTVNNPGTRQWFTITVLFAEHLAVTDVTIDTSSINTAGTAWEFTLVSFLDRSGVPFSPVPDIPRYLDFEPGLTGPTGTGHFLAAETGTVTGVGTDLTAPGTSGSHDQVNDTIADSDVTLPAGASIGGLVLTTTLEDVAGVDNGATAPSASVRQIEIAGTITLVVPDADLSTSKVGEVVDNQVVYEVTVENGGPDPASDVVVTDLLPPQVAYASDDCAASDVPPWTWDIGRLDAGSSVTCTIFTDIVQATTITNEATVTAAEDDPDPTNNTATVEVDADPTQPTTTTTLPTTTTTQQTTTIAETTTTTAETTTTAVPGVPTPDPPTGTLPATGSAIGTGVVVGGALLLVGACLVGVARRRRRAGDGT